MTNLRRRVRVGNWSNPRTVIVKDDKAALEIALSHNHCPTCAERVRYVTSQLAKRNIQYNWIYEGDKSFIQVAAPGSGLPIEEYFSTLLELTVN